MSWLAFGFGVLAGIALTLTVLLIYVRKSAVKGHEEARSYNERSLEALLERNRISQRQLELMEKGARP